MTALPHRDELLEVSWRVDWRFLLSDPELGDVVYVGRRNGALIEACSAFANSVSVIDPSTPSARMSADTVVAIDPRPNELRAAAECLRGGGSLYAEFSSFMPAAIRHARRPSLSRRCARTLEQLGFEDVRRQWHWPTFAACTEIVPLAEREALGHWLVRRQADGTLAKAVLARMVITSRVPAIFLATSVVGRRPEGAA